MNKVMLWSGSRCIDVDGKGEVKFGGVVLGVLCVSVLAKTADVKGAVA